MPWITINQSLWYGFGSVAYVGIIEPYVGISMVP